MSSSDIPFYPPATRFGENKPTDDSRTHSIPVHLAARFWEGLAKGPTSLFLLFCHTGLPSQKPGSESRGRHASKNASVPDPNRIGNSFAYLGSKASENGQKKGAESAEG